MMPGPVRTLRPASPPALLFHPRGICTKCAVVYAAEAETVCPFRMYPALDDRHVGSTRRATLFKGAAGLPISGRVLVRYPSPWASAQAPVGIPFKGVKGWPLCTVPTPFKNQPPRMAFAARVKSGRVGSPQI